MTIRGLVLAGGFSRRMNQDKGSLVYHGVDQRTWCSKLLGSVCDEVYISCRKEQKDLLSPLQKGILDRISDIGPASGLLSAHLFSPASTWLVLACDLPFVTLEALRDLVGNRDFEKDATVYVNSREYILEPLFAIWEPTGLSALAREVEKGHHSLIRTLKSLNCRQVFPRDSTVLTNVNSPIQIA